MTMNILLSVATGDFMRRLDLNRPSLLKWWPGSIHAWQDELPPYSPTHANQPYAFKAYAAQWAFDQGYETVTWVDSSIHMEGSADAYIRHLHEVGYYFQHNGFNCAQTCSDSMLDHYKVSRDAVEHVPEVVGGFWGLHRRNRSFVDELVANSRIGLFSGSRCHDTRDSGDPRFLFCRHDQSLMSLLVMNRQWGVNCASRNTTFFNYRSSSSNIRPVECFVLV